MLKERVFSLLLIRSTTISNFVFNLLLELNPAEEKQSKSMKNIELKIITRRLSYLLF